MSRPGWSCGSADRRNTSVAGGGRYWRWRAGWCWLSPWPSSPWSRVSRRARAPLAAAQEREAAQRVTAEANADARATAQAEAEAAEEDALRQASVGLAAKALAELEGTAPERGVLLALEALEHYPYTPQAESALAQIVEDYIPYLALEHHPDPILTMALRGRQTVTKSPWLGPMIAGES